MTTEIRTQAFDPWHEIQHYQTEHLEAGKYGATASFIGSMRDFNEGDNVQTMTLEHYPGMTENYLDKICEEAKTRWDIIDCLIIHRVGEVSPNDPIVLTAVWSAHRAAAFDACRYLMEELKSRAPFWKKESLPDGERWVDRNTPG
ncbi:MAG: molybdenum cofactor biosynthesis protein MoaE [Gammaproteobacteria bacterium]|nr:molybdenum cofactor biosynthesis protein MoaE [Gammaproteobacteria bacterium]MCW8909273.1 molybdenum cofactor biosynthesis protein MoaE [Gammaproteobacteria bacterium]